MRYSASQSVLFVAIIMAAAISSAATNVVFFAGLGIATAVKSTTTSSSSFSKRFFSSSVFTNNKRSFRSLSLSSSSSTAFVVPRSRMKRKPSSSFKSNSRLSMTTDVADNSNDNNDNLYWTTDKVRSTFVDYFVNTKDHTEQLSSACAPLNDPTLLFTNAGMNQFKSIFLGQTDPSSPLYKLKSAANSQKCIRAGGKHNDLEDVGRDTYHHTFFEMLGSWSFNGEYFKKEAIQYAWELLTDVYKLDPSRIYATYFAGDTKNKLEPDYEARDLWLQYLPAERVIGCDAKDNFWEMGETGPCGPCSEIHYDRIGNRDASSLVNADDPNVIEIWNIVFIQYNRDDEVTLTNLPQKHIDTGMGLERLVSLLQNKTSNYDIDVFTPIFDKINEYSNVGPYTGLVLDDDTTLKDTAYRAIADHARTLSFAIADGALPNNEGRGYVLRRILRRATRYGQQILKCQPGFFVQLIPTVVDVFGDAYPELVRNQQTIIDVVKEEESSFSSMLERGIKFFTELKDELKTNNVNEVSGDKCFFLYDTLGFPIDLTELMADEAGLKVDIDGFYNEMEKQKQRSRDARKAAKQQKGGGEGGVPQLELIAEQTSWLSDNYIKPTDDSFKYEEWDINNNKGGLSSTVKAIFTPNGEFLTNDEGVKSGDIVGLVLDRTSFYAEAGGQESDTGVINILSDEDEDVVVGKFTITDVQTYGGYILHSGMFEAESGDDDASLNVGTFVKCLVNYDHRRKVAPNHSMTHILNAALLKVLGDGVDQRGSLCNDEKLRFDFSHKKAMTKKQLQQTEQFCQQAIIDSMPVSSQVMPLADAQSINGVRAVFGEVYPDPVRVVSMGSNTDDNASIEFCGGTHISNTADAEAFVLIEETAVAKGIRRISAVTKDAAKRAIEEGTKFESIVKDAELLNADTTPDLDKKAGSMRKELDSGFMSAPLKAELRERIEKIQKKGVQAKKAALAGRLDECITDVKAKVEDATTENKRAIVLNVDIGADSKLSQKIINEVKSIAPDLAFMGISEEDVGSGGKLMAFALVPDTLVNDEGFKADDWVRATLEPCGGRGGGKPVSAQGQAKECTDVDSVMKAATAFAESKVGDMVAL